VRGALSAYSLADVQQPPAIAARHLTSALEGYFSDQLRVL